MNNQLLYYYRTELLRTEVTGNFRKNRAQHNVNSEDHCHCRCKKKLYFRCTSVGGVSGNYGQKCAPDHE